MAWGGALTLATLPRLTHPLPYPLQIGVAYAFTLVGFLQMSQWALQKHAGYKKADESYKKLGRKAIVPFLL